MKKIILAIGAMALLFSPFVGQDQRQNPPEVKYHLTARPWQSFNMPREAYLDKIEGIVRYIAKFQDSSGAIIDPHAKEEIQYSTPYFANALGTLLSAGRARDLLDKGIAAMNRVTSDIDRGASAMPQNHGNFYLAPAGSALALYEPHVSASLMDTWRKRMSKPVDQVIYTRITTNWKTYAMKGEWFRAKAGVVSASGARSWVEKHWNESQRAKTTGLYNMYHDGTSDPDTFPYEAAARGNLLNMLAAGYDGASRGEIEGFLKRASRASLLTMDPTGQASASGRSGNHTWNDIVYGNAFETMAEMVHAEGQTYLAGQYRRAASLTLNSIDRWRREDKSYSVTKNHFKISDRVHHANYSHVTNYNGYLQYHMSENYLRRKSNIPEQPAPVEIGGYTITTDNKFGVSFANAGGMQMQINYRGATSKSHDVYWTPLGVVRFSRVGWDSRLGPSDGIRESGSGQGVSFAPTFEEGGNWVRLASVPGRYEGTFSTQFTHPMLVRCAIDYKPKGGNSGPSFRQEFIITPDGVLSTTTSTGGQFGVTWPILTFDGRTQLKTNYTSNIASVSFPGQTDEQNYIALHNSPSIYTGESTRRSAYGDLRPVRVTAPAGERNITFVYPRNASDPSAEAVRTSFARSGNDFSSVLGYVKGNVYVGRTSAGGEAESIDLDGDNAPDATFSQRCGFILQLRDGVVTNVEADRAVSATVQGKRFELKAYTPQSVNSSEPTPVTAKLNLLQGWNLISLPVQPTQTSITAVLSGIQGKYSALYGFEGGNYQSYIPGESDNNLSQLKAGSGYWILMDEAAQLEITGSRPSTAVNLKEGWNLVGFNSTASKPVEQAFSSIRSSIDIVYGFDNPTYGYKTYSPSEGGQLTQLDPGTGYWVYAIEDVSWKVE
jgi:hypothetical protein